MMNIQQSSQLTDIEDIEGLDSGDESWGDYPIDDLLIRSENRTIYEVLRRIDQDAYVMDPDFQRDFIWPEDKQSKLVESVMMRIPLPVFYMAEDDQGRMVVVDGLQRLSTFRRFVKNDLRLVLPGRTELHGKKFSDLSSKLQNRVEDCNLIFYIIDSKAPERTRLDIFERVNSGMPLSRQQMRNCLFMGQATLFLKREAQSETFRNATGKSLNSQNMRDREFVNRFCAFQILGVNEYRGDMDEFLANSLRRMNELDEDSLSNLSTQLQQSLANNLFLFDQHAFRKHSPERQSRSVLNASLWDVMSTGLSHYSRNRVEACADSVRQAVEELLADQEFSTAISYGPNDPRKVRQRFQMAQRVFEETLGAHAN